MRCDAEVWMSPQLEITDECIILMNNVHHLCSNDEPQPDSAPLSVRFCSKACADQYIEAGSSQEAPVLEMMPELSQ
ncbi:hypothetical protein PHYPSEUDO_008919 [Phytophthora pseudosyringae]|uniref:Uncharacterized protein n=1 Tax=Phytophthora pseudosyringae TaxID=221518 RepID=A0A8T1VG97_9STRA|nr:hypothetical protein PHYPSEUDO_008919 [Phytophthora pseudosyringae]